MPEVRYSHGAMQPECRAHTDWPAAYSAFVDIYLAVYPTIVLYKLQLSLKKKLALCVALGVGSMWVPSQTVWNKSSSLTVLVLVLSLSTKPRESLLLEAPTSRVCPYQETSYLG